MITRSAPKLPWLGRRTSSAVFGLSLLLPLFCWTGGQSIKANPNIIASTTGPTLCSGAGSLAVITDFGSDAVINATVLQPDQKIVTAGHAVANGQFVFALARYNPDGSLDTSFGSGGRVTTAFTNGSASARALVIQPDGKIVVAGIAHADSGLGGNTADFALARYNSSGALDSSFGAGGRVTTDFNGDRDVANALVIRPNGKLVAVGSAVAAGGSDDFALAGYDTDGQPDISFGTNGKQTTDFASNTDRANAAALQLDGKIVAAGLTGASGNFAFALARYTTDGALDPGFGMGGKMTTDFTTADDRAFAVAIQTDGKIARPEMRSF